MTSLCHYPLTVAGVGITLQTRQQLPVSERFRPFLDSAAAPDYCVDFREVHRLPAPQGSALYCGSSFEVFADGAGGFERRYFNGMHGFVRFARTGDPSPDGVVTVEYLDSERELLSEMGNCFAFSGWEMLLLRKHRLLLHASCVDTPLGGLLFSGPSGIGKSTQAALWQQYAGAELINGDRPILQKTAGGWLAWGSPYAGSSRWFVNKSCRVRAVVMLRQAQRCSLRKLDGAAAFRALFAGVTVSSWDGACVRRACDMAEALVRDVPVYEFNCTPDRAAVELLGTELEREGRR